MKFIRSLLFALALATGAAAPAAALAQPAMTAAEQADLALIERAFEAVGRRGYAGLDPLLPQLRAAMDRAPASEPSFETGPGYVIVRPADPEQAPMLTLFAAAVAAENNASVAVDVRPSTYSTIAMLLASEAVERGRYEEGVAHTVRGLALQPDNGPLILERSIALMALGRNEDALAVIDAALAESSITLEPFQSYFLRRRGSLLIRLARWAEARAALQQSLELDPGNPLTLNELATVERGERGQAVGDFELTRPEAVAPTED